MRRANFIIEKTGAYYHEIAFEDLKLQSDDAKNVYDNW